MNRRRGFTLTEAVSASAIMMLAIGGVVALLMSGSQGLANSVAMGKTGSYNAQGLRYMSQTLRSAMSVTINDAANRIDYTLPKYTSSADNTTGEKEYIDPLTSDGITRYFLCNRDNGTITDSATGKVIVRYLYPKDPEKGSSQYNLIYPIFQLTTIGSAKAVTITVVTQDQVGKNFKYVRLKTSTVLRNF